MSVYTEQVNDIKRRYANKVETRAKIEDLMNDYKDAYTLLDIVVEAQRILATVADQNTTRVVNFIEGVINKALLEMYPNGDYRIEVVKSMYGGNKPQMDVTLYSADGKQEDLDDQAGDGVARIISLIFSLAVIELQGTRKFVAVDEVLNGFHEDSLVIVKRILDMFQRGGFQFVMSEYDINDMGVIYKCEKHTHHNDIELLGKASEVNYTRDVDKAYK